MCDKSCIQLVIIITILITNTIIIITFILYHYLPSSLENSSVGKWYSILFNYATFVVH